MIKKDAVRHLQSLPDSIRRPRQRPSPQVDDPELIIHASEGNYAAVRGILQNPKININVRDELERTPLILAIFHGHFRLAAVLAKEGADLFAMDKMGNTILHYLAGNGDERYVRLALAAGLAVDEANAQGKTALMNTAAYGKDEVIRALLEAGADPNIEDKKGETAVYHALSQAKDGAFEILLRYGADLRHVNLKNKTVLEALQAEPLPSAVMLGGRNKIEDACYAEHARLYKLAKYIANAKGYKAAFNRAADKSEVLRQGAAAHEFPEAAAQTGLVRLDDVTSRNFEGISVFDVLAMTGELKQLFRLRPGQIEKAAVDCLFKTHIPPWMQKEFLADYQAFKRNAVLHNHREDRTAPPVRRRKISQNILK